MRAQLLHLSGPDRGRTLTYQGRVVTVGAAPTCDAVLSAPGVAEKHAQIEFVEEECQFHLRRRQGQVFVNGTEVEEVILQDGDRLEFGAGGPVARFRIYVPNGAVCKPVRRMLADARDVASVSGGAAATQTLTRDLLTQATTRLKIGVPLALVAGAFLAGWFGGWMGSQPDEAERARRAEVVTRQELEQLKKQQPVDTVTRAELETVRQAQQQQHEELARLARANAIVLRIQREWSRGVCLLHGIFRLRMPDKTWFELGGTEPFEVEYTGSGFRVTEAGHIVTNRHVVAPWLEMQGLSRLIERGATPEFTHLTATFPGHAPLDVPPASILRRQDDLDVAVVQVDGSQLEGVPILPLHAQTVDAEDQRAIVVGYPTGLAALLARADNDVVEELRQRSATMTEAIAVLAAKGDITPIITQGVISNRQERVMVYDATTTHGGSGGPVFDSNGEVVAVNFAILPDFTGANFGVPIRFASELLPK
ncbi:MAG TPA: trypsin-like peptidase domain-containing protein [Planctomycetota bacterium]|nr:trypsin-like peptidase domain-containing protein [Planctomycetota bacterium]